MNPFFTKSPLPYEAPPFDQIEDSDYAPALEEGMKQGLAEADAIATSDEPPTFENTIVAMEASGVLLGRVSRVFYGLAHSNTNEAMQAVQQEMAPKMAAHGDAIWLNPRLYARVEAIYDARESLDAESKYLTERYHRDFVRAGAQLSEKDQTELKAINQEESSLTTEFGTKLLAANKAGALVVEDLADLEGLSEADLVAAADAAKSRKLAGKWVLTLQNTTQQPAQVSLKRRATRKKLYEAATSRAEHGDANDTRALIQRLATLRARRAKLLGFPTYAAYVLDDQMAKTPAAAIKLLTDMVPAAVAQAQGEAKRMQALANHETRETERFELAAWDWQFYAEQVRKNEYALDDAAIKPYFELNRVLENGLFFAANALYGISFHERKDLPVYQEDVRVWDVLDESGRSFGLFYGDYFKRDNKSGGAWMSSFVDQSGLMKQSPVIYNVCNFTKPEAGKPALLSFDEVITLFHEFGHALHGLSSNVKYPTLAGTSVPRDFVEFPSQFNENWATEPAVFANYAKHHHTGEAMPGEMVEKLKAARKFNQGFATTEYLGAALLDMAWHTLDDGPHPEIADVAGFAASARKHFDIDYPLVPPRYGSSYFAHIFGGGYGAGYYAYLWSEVIDHDAFAWFEENGGMTRANGKRFQEMILARGYSEPLGELYKKFRGREPSVEPLLAHRGLATAK